MEFYRKWQYRRLTVKIDARPKESLWGRFGAGWDWALGFKAASNDQYVSILVFLLVFSVKVSFSKGVKHGGK